MMPGMLLIRSDNSPEVFFATDAHAMEQYREFQQDFGGGKALRIAFNGGGIWTKQGLAWIADLEQQAAKLQGTKAAIGLATHHRWLELEWPPPEPAGFRQMVLENGLDRGAGWVSGDGEIITMLMVLENLSPAQEGELLKQLETLLANPPNNIQTHISGLPVLHRAMDRSLLKMAARFLPLLVLMAVTFLFYIFRRPRIVAVPLVYVFMCETILFGMMGYLGVRINLVNIIISLLLFVISLATAVHLMIYFRQTAQQAPGTREAVVETYRNKGWPVLWTGLTTLVAFGSLLTGSVPPVRTLGGWSAVGIIIMTALAFTFYPLLLAGVQAKNQRHSPRPYETGTRKLGKTLARWAIRRRWMIIVSAVLLIIIALSGFPRLWVEDNLGKYFPSHHPVRAGLEQLQANGVGVYAAELVIDSPTSFRDPAAQQRLAKLSGLLRTHPMVYGAVSSGDLLEAAANSLLVEGEMNDNIRWMALGMLQSVPETRTVLDSLVNADGQRARVTLMVPMLSANRILPLFQQAKEDAARIFPDANIWITGRFPLILLAQQSLLQGLIQSLTITLLCIMVIFLLLLRSSRFTLAVLIPNLWPIILVLGGMSWLNLPLDSGSVLTTSIVLGLAVDDTFHTLGHYRGLLRLHPPPVAIEKTIERTAPAHILTTIILAAGFTACYFSDFLPVSRMGAFSAAAILLALIGDLILIPALLGNPPRKGS